MIITVASGKGGTGKTTFSVNLAYALAQNKKVRLLDCDVEGANDNLFVKAGNLHSKPVEISVPEWNVSKCVGCGLCAEACSFNALAKVKRNVLVFSELCHSCGVCLQVCQYGAITEVAKEIGKVESSVDAPFFFAQGILNIGESLAAKVVKAVKNFVSVDSVNIIDASPGAGCSVVESMSGADVSVLVTEPTPFGLNDLKLAVQLSLKMGIPTGIVINRSDGRDAIIHNYANKVNVPVIGAIPFKREYAEAYSKGEILTNNFPEFKDSLTAIYARIEKLASSKASFVFMEDEDVKVANKEKVHLSEGTSEDFKEITIISGKGGVGKTTIAASFAALAKDKIIADCDVDAADMHLLLKPGLVESHEFSGGKRAVIDAEKCSACGACAKACRFEAVKLSHSGKSYEIDAVSCEGCGLCFIVCPEGAASMKDAVNGAWFVSNTKHGPMSHARLGIGEENSGKLVTQVRNKATELAVKYKMPLIVSDGPPGTGCPVIASISGSDLALVATEPTVSGVHDMTRALMLTKHFGLPAVVIINKADLNLEMTRRIHETASEFNAEVIAEIPFDQNVNEALRQGLIPAEYSGPAAEVLKAAWLKIKTEYLENV